MLWDEPKIFFLERRYFFSIILSEFLKNRVALQQVTRFTYTVTNYPQRPDGVQLNLYICEDLPVAGDVVCTGTDGFQDTLVFPQQTDAS